MSKFNEHGMLPCYKSDRRLEWIHGPNYVNIEYTKMRMLFETFVYTNFKQMDNINDRISNKQLQALIIQIKNIYCSTHWCIYLTIQYYKNETEKDWRSATAFF